MKLGALRAKEAEVPVAYLEWDGKVSDGGVDVCVVPKMTELSIRKEAWH